MSDTTRADVDAAAAKLAAEAADADGQSIEDMGPDDFFDGMFGTDPQMTFDLGSDFVVSRASLKVGAIPEIPVRGQWKDGEKIKLEIEVQVEQIHFKPVETKTGMRIGTERKHIARVLSADQIEEKAAKKPAARRKK